MIRKAEQKDLPQLDVLYENARHFMHTHGNPSQWNDGHPCRKDLSEDLAEEVLYVVEEQDEIIGAFVMRVGEDPTYQQIDGRAWRSSGADSLVLHKVCSCGKRRGIGHIIMTFAKAQNRDIRIDTHKDNRFMKSLLAREGFDPLGVIYLANGDPRDAFEFLQNKGPAKNQSSPGNE